jgi:hypothetical protein
MMNPNPLVEDILLILHELNLFFDQENKCYQERRYDDVSSYQLEKKRLLTRYSMLLSSFNAALKSFEFSADLKTFILDQQNQLQEKMNKNVLFAESMMSAIDRMMNIFRNTASEKTKSTSYQGNGKVPQGVFRPSFAINQVI